MIARIRPEVAKLPSSGAAYYRHQFAPSPPRFSPLEINGLLPADHRVVYDVRQVIARLVDSSLFWEILPARRRGDGHRHRAHRRALRRHHRQQPAAHPAPGDARAQPARRDPLPRGDRQDLPVLAHLRLRRDPDPLAAGHLRLRHRPGGGEARAAWLRLQPALHELDEQRADDHRPPAQGLRRRLLRHDGAALRAVRPDLDPDHAPGGHGGANPGHRGLPDEARRQLPDHLPATRRNGRRSRRG